MAGSFPEREIERLLTTPSTRKCAIKFARGYQSGQDDENKHSDRIFGWSSDSGVE